MRWCRDGRSIVIHLHYTVAVWSLQLSIRRLIYTSTHRHHWTSQLFIVPQRSELQQTNTTRPTQRPSFHNNLGKPVSEKQKHCGFQWSKRWRGGSGISWTIEHIGWTSLETITSFAAYSTCTAAHDHFIIDHFVTPKSCAKNCLTKLWMWLWPNQANLTIQFSVHTCYDDASSWWNEIHKRKNRL